MKCFSFILFMFLSCSLLGQENSFHDYLNHFGVESDPPRSDSLCMALGEDAIISPEYVSRYIADLPATTGNYQYRYYYGTKLVNNNYALVLVFRSCDDYQTQWGRGVTECFLIVYSMEGQKVSQSLIGTDSDGQCFNLSITSGTAALPPNIYTAMIIVYQTTLLNCLDEKKQTYQGVKYVRVYNVNRLGIIERFMPQKRYKDVLVSKKNGFEINEMEGDKRNIALTTNNVSSQFYLVDIIRLNNAYKELMDHPKSASAQKAYFDAFPSTWEEFIMTYQYIPDKEYDLTMFFKACDHLEAWYHLTSIPDSVYCNKLISIAIGGRAQDGSHEFYGLKPLLKWAMKNKMETMFSVLSHLRKGHQFEFWAFYWSSLNYQEMMQKEYELLKQKNEKPYADAVAIMSDAYKYFHNGANPVGSGFKVGNRFTQQ